MEYSNGEVYDGAWKDNIEHGYGQKTFIDGCKYKGCWNMGQAEGRGIWTF
jgi:hypothetical protein